MYRWCAQITFDGSEFCGWQIQANQNSIQQNLQEVLSLLLNEKIEIVGCGRTDAGVHAFFYVFHFDTKNLVDVESLVYKANRFLKQNIRVFDIQQVANNFHARFDAKSREYKYFIALQKQVFFSKYSWFLPLNFDIDKLNKVSAILCEYSDFTSFSKLHSSAKTNICKVEKAVWEQKGDLLIFTIRADRFLWNMVRSIVGTLVEVAKGKLDKQGFIEIIEAKDRCKAGQSAPAQALFLNDVEYGLRNFVKNEKSFIKVCC
ncbi:MAG: tRNA pseudouridine(38-40) synthase TruA [Bacteroidales bacterium]|nr:tRNA pseudouridine(38-40) synthase TruA [Bacteroidales bacterium]